MANPDTIANLELWYKADAITGMSDSDRVGTWEDSSVNNRDATQSTAAEKPVYKTGRINGKPAVWHPGAADAPDGTNTGLTTSYSVVNPFTVFVVYNRTRAGTSETRTVQGSGGNNWLIGPYNGNHSYYNGAFITNDSVAIGTFVYATVTQAVTGGVFRVNGVQIGTNANTNQPGTFVTGGPEGSFNEAAHGDIAEICVYSRVLEASEITTVEGYLYNKYFVEPVGRSYGYIF